MSDPNIAIAVTDVSRMFKRYRHPRHRVMEAFGLPLPRGAYDEFWALRGISLELRRGDSLGLIGQNGAGKSTLLNIICGRLQPSSGTVAVRGNIQALMEMGTGFHPEFTGRDNILSALAYQGVIGREAHRRLEEIIDFSELAEFIDQPVKTYSSGMYARLAFSTATAIVPDILIIDEVLGAGDAYFAVKSAERMQRLTKETGATVLFVSHDIQAVQRLCERAIWIDRGQIKMASAALEVSKAYYADVNAREEARLRAQTTLAVSRMRRRDETASATVVESVRNEHAAAAGEPVWIEAESVTISQRRDSLASTEEAQTCDGESVAIAIERRERPPAQNGETPRAITGPEQAPALIGALPSDTADGMRGESAAESSAITLNGALDGSGSAAPAPHDRWETDEGRFTDICTCNAVTGARQHVFGLGEALVFRIDIELAAAVPVCWLACVIYDALGNRVSLLVHQIEEGLESGRTEILLRVEQINLRQGEYVVSLELLPVFDYNWPGPHRLPYLCHWDRCVYFKVDESYRGAISLGLVALSATVTVQQPVEADHRTVTSDAAAAAG